MLLRMPDLTHRLADGELLHGIALLNACLNCENNTSKSPLFVCYSKILELEEELKVVGNNMKSLELSEQEVG